MSNIRRKFGNYPPANEASREVANLTERKKLHTPVYGVKEFVCLSVCLSVVLFDLSSYQNQKPSEKSLQLWLPELFF